MRPLMVALLMLLCSVSPASVDAKAHLIAVLVLRSTAALAPAAASLSKQIADRAAELPGYDTQVVAADGRRDVDAAAAVGAEIYIVGQLIGGVVTVDSFDVASDHRIGTMRVLVPDGRLPDSTDFAPLVTAATGVAQGSAITVPATIGSSYVLVPFAPPGNKDTALDFATTEFVKKLQAKGIVAVATEPLEEAQAGASVPQLCKEHSAKGVLIGTARHEQRLNYLLGSYPTHAEVRVTLFPCDASQPLWKGYGTGDIVYYWSNAGAAISDVLDRALDIIVAQFPDAPAAATPMIKP